MNCFGSMLKYIIYIFNLIFLICGVLLITLGSIMLSGMGDFKNFDDTVNTETIPILTIVLGCIIFCISFFGCCGAIRENIFCTTLYSVSMFILFCLQIALCVWVFVKRSDVLSTMGKLVDTAFDENDTTHGYPMDALQLAFKCCGKQSYQDYQSTVPNSCCGTVSDTPGICQLSEYEYRPGCRQEFVDFWGSNMDIISYGSIGVAIVELVAFTFACCLISSIRSSRQRG